MADAVGGFEDGRRVGGSGASAGEFLDHGKKRIEVTCSNAWHVRAQNESEFVRTAFQRNPESFERAHVWSLTGDESLGPLKVRERITTNNTGSEHEVVQRGYGVRQQRTAVPNGQCFIAAEAGRFPARKNEPFHIANG